MSLRHQPFIVDTGAPVRERSQQLIEERTTHDLLVSQLQLQEEQLAVSRHILSALQTSSDSRSSIEVKTSTRGVDITAKAYEGSPIDDVQKSAVEAYFRVLADVQERLNGGPKATA